MKLKPLVVMTMVIVSAGAVVTPAAATQDGQTGANATAQATAQAGAHVEFETTGTAIVDYTVDGETVVENLTVTSDGESGADGGFGFSGDSQVSASGLSVASSLSASASAELRADSGATVETHDNEHGVFVVSPNSQGESQGVQLGLGSDAEAESESDQRVVVTAANGSTATVLATGDGTVSVTDSGNLSASTGSNGEVVYRQYEGDRSESDRSQERMIMNGTATAEVYVQQAADSGESAGQSGESQAVNVVNYGQDTTVEVTERSATTVNATVDRSQSEGRAVIMTVSEAAFENADDASVFVDGEAAVEADSYSEVRSATNDGNSSAYYVDQSASAEATTDVVVGINHFSTREVSLQSTEDGSTESGDSENQSGESGTTSGNGPGFGVTAALAALMGIALLARRR